MFCGKLYIYSFSFYQINQYLYIKQLYIIDIKFGDLNLLVISQCLSSCCVEAVIYLQKHLKKSSSLKSIFENYYLELFSKCHMVYCIP